MNNIFMRQMTWLTVAVLVAVLLIGGAAVANAAEPKLDNDWHFTIIPYVWLPSVNGKMNINLPSGGGSNDFDISSGSYLNNFQFAALLGMELEKGNWPLLADFMYVDFSDSGSQVTFPNLPGGRVSVTRGHRI